MDALRADHVSALGYRHKTTPQLTRLAAESLVFTHAYSQSSATMFSIPSMLAGLNPENMRWWERKNHPQVHNEHELFPERLVALGYRRGVILTSYLIGQYPGLQQGFADVYNIYLDGHPNPWAKRASPISLSKSIDFLHGDPKFETDSAKPFFLLSYFDDPHSPYEKHAEDGISGMGKGKRGAYNQEILLADRNLGSLLDHLRYKPHVWDNTIVIVTADHGEEFRERGHTLHSRTCYVESTHVPLFVRIPGIARQRIHTSVALADLLPTLVELLDLKLKPGEVLDGKSLLIPALAPGRVDPARPIFCSILPQLRYMGNFSRRSVRSGKWALMKDDIAGTVELYDTFLDPAEKKSLATNHAFDDVVARLTRFLTTNERGNMRSANWVRD